MSRSPLVTILSTPLASAGIAAAGMKAAGRKTGLADAFAWGQVVRSTIEAIQVLRGVPGVSQ